MDNPKSMINEVDEITTTVATINLVRAKAYADGILHERRRALTALEAMLEDVADETFKMQLSIVYSTIKEGEV